MSLHKTKLLLSSLLLSATIPAFSATDLAVDLSMPQTAKIDDTIKYTIFVDNNGPEVAKDIIVSYQMPDGLSFISAKSFLGECGISDQTVTCQLRNLRVGSTARIRGKISTSQSGIYSSNVSVSSSDTDTRPDNNQQSGALTVINSSDLEVTITDSEDPVKPGEAVTYTTTVTNHGPDNADHFFVETVFHSLDDAPQALESARATGADCVITALEDNTPAATCEFANVAVGDSVSMTSVVRPVKMGISRVTANINQSDDWDNPNRFNNQTTEITKVLGFKTQLKVKIKGEGTVIDAGLKINCGEQCDVVYPRNQVIRLTATASPGSVFVRWWGSCSGDHHNCVVQMSKARRVTAVFEPIEAE